MEKGKKRNRKINSIKVAWPNRKTNFDPEV